MSRGYFEKGVISSILDANRGNYAFSKEIFLLVALELWHRAFVDQGSVNL
jgi:asparagine synthase (glutamine-hydrolysing)